MRQSLLQSAHPAAGDLPADRRLPAAGGSAGGRVRDRSTPCGSAKRRCPTCRWSAPATRILQDYLPNVAQATVRDGWTDFVGLGRMVLAYPDLPADTLAGRTLAAQARLPHVQRLHHGAAQRSHLRLLSARPVLQSAAGARAAHGNQTALAILRRYLRDWHATLSLSYVSGERVRFSYTQSCQLWHVACTFFFRGPRCGTTMSRFSGAVSLEGGRKCSSASH